jgi:hypothetical protein
MRLIVMVAIVYSTYKQEDVEGHPCFLIQGLRLDKYIGGKNSKSGRRRRDYVQSAEFRLSPVSIKLTELKLRETDYGG